MTWAESKHGKQHYSMLKTLAGTYHAVNEGIRGRNSTVR